MAKIEILWNENLNDYTYETEIDGVKSIKREPIKYKSEDRTSKYRKEILKESILNNNISGN